MDSFNYPSSTPGTVPVFTAPHPLREHAAMGLSENLPEGRIPSRNIQLRRSTAAIAKGGGVVPRKDDEYS